MLSYNTILLLLVVLCKRVENCKAKSLLMVKDTYQQGKYVGFLST